MITDGGGVSHVVEVWRDITDRRSAEARLADTERMASLGMLASGFSHEVNTPLGSIRMCLDAIRRICSAPEFITPEQRQTLAEYARTGTTQVDRAAAITEQFLNLSRGKSLPRTALDLPKCVAVVAGLCRQRAQGAGVAIEVSAFDGELTVSANESSVQQVLLNLLLNAIDASKSGQRIAITFTVDRERAVVHIADEGHGIAESDLPRIFEPFFSRRKGGTGLGLFVSKNFAERWGGDIVVESRPGGGATFSVVCPRGEVEHAADPSPGR